MTTETLLELAEIALKKNIFQFNEKTLKQLRQQLVLSVPYRMQLY